jgi:hypothetical protein
MADPIGDALLPGETVLWRGRPSATARGASPAALRVLGASGALASGLGAALTVYALAAALRHGDHFEAPFLFMLALVTMALFAACVRFAVRPYKLGSGDDERLHYAVTPQRVIVAVDASPPASRALPIDAALLIDDTIAASGQGSLVFCSGDMEPIMFDGIENAPAVLNLIQSARDAAT